MATFKSLQVTNKMPIPSHGDASSAKCQHFQIVLGATAAADVIELGYLPDYAVPVELIVHHTAAITGLSVGTAADPDGLMPNTAVVANTPLRATGACVELYKNLGLGGRLITATVGGTGGSAGTLNVCIFYVCEDAGVGYPLTAAA